jgi:hypothetical protein
MSAHGDPAGSIEERPAPARRLQISILEIMLLVAALAVSFRWPGLTVPLGLVFLYALAQRRDILRRQTRVAFGQVALALYLPPVLAFLALHLWGKSGPADWRAYWSFVGFEHFAGMFIGRLSLIPALLPGLLIAVGLHRAGAPFRAFEGDIPEMVVLSLISLAVLVGLAMIAKRGSAWRVACLLVAAGMSALSTWVAFVMSVAGA